ncbi:hypothetical protein IAT38_006073 [Cryptococcus sp. DSM 104549]
MSKMPIFMTILKAFTLCLAIVIPGISATFVSYCDDFCDPRGWASGSTFAGGAAMIPGGLLVIIYFVTFFSVAAKSSDNLVVSVMMDTILLGSLFVFFLGCSAGLSDAVHAFDEYIAADDDGLYTFACFGVAALALGWFITWLGLFGILLYEVIYTLTHYGGAYSTWRMSFNRLAEYGTASNHNGGVGGAARGGGAGGAGASVGARPGMVQTGVSDVSEKSAVVV